MSADKPELVWALDIPNLTGCRLEDRGLNFVHQLLGFKESELRALPGIGKKGISAIKKGLAERGLSLRPE